MPSKKKTLLRIFIYLVLAFAPAFAIELIFSDKNGGVNNLFLGATLMLYPAIASVITRLVTKEGFRDAMLGFGKRGSGKYYAAAVIYPVVLPFVSALILHLFIVENGRISDSAFGSDIVMGAASLLIAVISGIATAFHGLGEELGWRGYLTPRLEQLVPTPAAIVVTGVIWALWHGPLLAYGYNFGRDYDFFPYGGFIAMIVMCIFWSAVLTWLTKRTGSVYPAALCHMLIDTVLTTVFMPFAYNADGEKFTYRTNEFWMLIISVFPMIIVCGAVCMVLICKKGKSSAKV
ncbi:type II CAAX endopeptidase family protein [Ruminococcus sp.]|uniref:CPBP family intramembrane glutamic endopeptidase n=1 Tax=Ruminococcus sp. TaxID=41978 RepID=UPI001B45C287|nr:type II CAAX endopeptidase family protein [Ruminococcus sp.]MBP5433254.1 CPBP family intramembrane metalloprotease [Ruminococcus sp.]